MSKKKREAIDPIYKEKFIEDLNRFISKVQSAEINNPTTCATIFSNSDQYADEKAYLEELATENFSTAKDRGDALEKLIIKIFNRIDLLDGISITRKETVLGQLDLQLVTVRDFIYDVWGMTRDKPTVEYMIGECKNYTNPVGRPEIERICWRATKGACLAFFIATEYTKDALDEIAYFNQNKQNLLLNSNGVYVIPISISMIEAIVNNNINFCYFIKWAIKNSKIMSIVNYLKLT
ncbi:hypothetical protein [Pleurocapsa sp. FMAR1]|uniref:hypothetical protein n=1 Tax=Pleurocapsa sp. FMAR1 TaxID=3040204 RepID=UPI0029C7AAC3|nr:hypothetical protein [Pleurocapsa sp. FMAR1]